jgi:cation diffusion facilitator CzcD-associated flavoprotein CzcO
MTTQRTPRAYVRFVVSDRPDETGRRPRVLALGSGFGGIGAAEKLEKSDVDVVLVDGSVRTA